MSSVDLSSMPVEERRRWISAAGLAILDIAITRGATHGTEYPDALRERFRTHTPDPELSEKLRAAGTTNGDRNRTPKHDLLFGLGWALRELQPDMEWAGGMGAFGSLRDAVAIERYGHRKPPWPDAEKIKASADQRAALKLPEVAP